MNLLPVLYPLFFIAALFLGVIGTFLPSKHSLAKGVSASFFLSVILYFASVFFAEASILQKVIVLIRDMAILHVIVYTFTKLKFFKKALPFAFIALLIGASFFYNNVLKNTWKSKETTSQERISTNSDTKKAVSLDKDWELLIDLKDKNRPKAVMDIMEEYELELETAFPNIRYKEETNLDDYYAVNIPADKTGELAAIKQKLMDSGLVDWVDENEVIELDYPEVAKKVNKRKKINYGINDPGLDSLWGFDKMQVKSLYDAILGKKWKPAKVAKVAILDTGVDSDHEDIKANYVATDSKSNYDKAGHGTHCAGIAGAVSNNKIGIASFAPNNGFVQITSVKVLNDFGMGTQRSIMKGIIKAADTGADVISMSLGGPSRDPKKQKAYNDAISYANRAGVIIIVAAGNSNRDARNFAPANCKNVITVSAIDQNLDKASFSNTVDNIEMAVAAPGVNIYSTFPGDKKYAYLNGTSMATPYVSGLVGMMKALNPDLDTKKIHKILSETGINTKSPGATGRFIQPLKALEKVKE